jgi:hypothetical protein
MRISGESYWNGRLPGATGRFQPNGEDRHEDHDGDRHEQQPGENHCRHEVGLLSAESLGGRRNLRDQGFGSNGFEHIATGADCLRLSLVFLFRKGGQSE